MILAGRGMRWRNEWYPESCACFLPAGCVACGCGGLCGVWPPVRPAACVSVSVIHRLKLCVNPRQGASKALQLYLAQQ